MSDLVKTTLAWLHSWRKAPGAWTFQDYPLRVRINGDHMADGYAAQILNWPGTIGLGSTVEEALADLRANFDKRTDRPRPGSKVPVQFAESEAIAAYGDWAYDLTEAVTGLRPIFLSDSSSLSDFPIDLAEAQDRIHKRYGVDVSDIEYGYLLPVLNRLAAAGHGPSNP